MESTSPTCPRNVVYMPGIPCCCAEIATAEIRAQEWKDEAGRADDSLPRPVLSGTLFQPTLGGFGGSPIHRRPRSGAPRFFMDFDWMESLTAEERAHARRSLGSDWETVISRAPPNLWEDRFLRLRKAHGPAWTGETEPALRRELRTWLAPLRTRQAEIEKAERKKRANEKRSREEELRATDDAERGKEREVEVVLLHETRVEDTVAGAAAA